MTTDRAMIPMSELKDGVLYCGRCRNARVAKWLAAENQFVYIRNKFGFLFPEKIKHLEDPALDRSIDGFAPASVFDDAEQIAAWEATMANHRKEA